MGKTEIRVDLDPFTAKEQAKACAWSASFAMTLSQAQLSLAFDMACMTDEAVLQIAHMLRAMYSGTPAEDAQIAGLLDDRLITTPNRRAALIDGLSEAYRPEIMEKVKAYAASL